MNKTTSQRWGKFKVPATLVTKFDTSLKRIMGQCIIVRAEHMFINNIIEYSAISEHFRDLPEGEITPEYKWVFDIDGFLTAEEVK